MIERKITRKVKIGNVTIGGGEKIAVQSMTFSKTADKVSTLEQIKRLEDAGCDIVRFSVPDEESAKSVAYLKAHTRIPLVADIHFNYKLALLCVEDGIDKIRINPGNIGSDERVALVAEKCKAAGVPIRIGVNGGSLEKHILEKYGAPTPEALCESAEYHVGLLEKFGFHDIVVSIKSSDVQTTVAANRLFSSRHDYPLHLGVTEAGTERMGLIKSSAGIGSLLIDGIGDTLRVSLTDDVEKEVRAAHDLLKAIGIEKGLNIVSCPTCSRCNIDVIGIANRLTQLLRDCKKELTVAVMGCAVNGPGEAKNADIGVAGGIGKAVLFKKGEIIGNIPEENIIETLMKEIEKA